MSPRKTARASSGPGTGTGEAGEEQQQQQQRDLLLCVSTEQGKTIDHDIPFTPSSSITLFTREDEED
jgi:hypothetical protein